MHCKTKFHLNASGVLTSGGPVRILAHGVLYRHHAVLRPWAIARCAAGHDRVAGSRDQRVHMGAAGAEPAQATVGLRRIKPANDAADTLTKRLERHGLQTFRGDGAPAAAAWRAGGGS